MCRDARDLGPEGLWDEGGGSAFLALEGRTGEGRDAMAGETRSPLKVEALRNPGESLSAQLNEQLWGKTIYYIMIACAAVFMAVCEVLVGP